MQSHRLARLLRIIMEVRSRPYKPPEEIAGELNISLRQFYYDRRDLAKMGFEFVRTQKRFTVVNDSAITITAFPLSEILALVLATRHLFATKDFSIVRRALDGLYTLIRHMPEPNRTFLRELVEDVIVRDGFGCDPHILEALSDAVEEKQRILVQFHPSVRKKPVVLDPLGFCFKKSKLCFKAYVVAYKKERRYLLSAVENIMLTPFYRPEKA